MNLIRNTLRLISLTTLFGVGLVGTVGQTCAQAFITNFSLIVNGPRTVEFSGDAASYYILYSGSVVTNISQPIALVVGTAGAMQLQDTTAQIAAQFYRIAQVPITQPLDSDGDGIDDVFELNYPGCLNPLDPSDALA